jgi:hypothetical protein
VVFEFKYGGEPLWLLSHKGVAVFVYQLRGLDLT